MSALCQRSRHPSEHWRWTGRYLQSGPAKNHAVRGTSASCVVKHKVFTEKPRDARIEFAVERCPVEARGLVGANARYGGRELRRARCQERKVAGRYDMNVRFSREGCERRAPWPPDRQLRRPTPHRQNCSGILMAARLSCVKNPVGGSAITAARTRASCGGTGVRRCEAAHKIASSSLQPRANLAKSGAAPISAKPV